MNTGERKRVLNAETVYFVVSGDQVSATGLQLACMADFSRKGGETQPKVH